MRLESRMPEAAKAWRNTQDRLTSGRDSERESHESEAMCQNTGLVPEGGLARHRVEERAATCLPPPKADVPSRATGRGQNRTQASEVAREGMVCSTVSGASYSPGQPGKTHRGDRWGQAPHTAPTMATGHHATPRWHRHRAQTPLDTQTWFKDGTAPIGYADPSGPGTANSSTPSLGTRMGSQTVTAHLGLSPRTVAYLLAADIVSRPLPSRLRKVNQPVIITRNRFSRPRPCPLACICAH
jgi:hypothetical protein